MPITKPFSESSEQNKAVILEVLKPRFAAVKTVLEVASGTGQHAVHFANALPHLSWQPTDLEHNLLGIQQWINDSGLDNVHAPKALDVSSEAWALPSFDAIYSANSFHIMSQQNVRDFFARIAHHINPNGLITIYGPFNYQGTFTSESNARFNEWLTTRDPLSGIKAFEWCDEMAQTAGFQLLDDVEMPHNNRILCWQKRSCIHLIKS